MGKFTKQQRQAIEARGNVVVVAGAGTGKTRTLVHRCVEWLLEDPRKHSLDQVLVVTFTDAAAAELRQRIRAELTARLAVEPTNIHLLEQAALLDSAFISTLHSFCFRLLRQHFYELEIDPQVTVLPEEESRLLADETLRDMLERHFAGETRASEEVQKLIHAQARGWDVPVKRLILRLHEYAQTLPDPVGWLQSQRAAFCHSSPVEWRGWLHAAVLEWREQWTPVLQPFAGVKNVSDCLNALQRLPTNPTTDQAFTVLSDVGEAYRQVWPRGSVGKVRDVIQPFFDEAEFLRGLTQPAGQKPEDSSAPQLPGTPLEQDWSWVAPQMTVLLDLTAEFGERLSQAKKELGGVDFHDLEQFSLRLLWNGTTDQPTPLAMIWRERLQMIFVDEYQDINAAQDAILRALGRDGAAANRFLVGDPKQSIYRFRLADPRIFRVYTEQWADRAPVCHVIPLAENFRSREAILEFVNGLFSLLMRKETGGVSYDKAAHLQFGDAPGREHLRRAKHPTPADKQSSATEDESFRVPDVELNLLRGGGWTGDDLAGDESESSDGGLVDLTQGELEARWVGSRLAALHAQGRQLWDEQSKAYRRIEWRDMVVLLRSPQRKAETYAKEFTRLKIPLVAARGGFFDHPEVTDLLSLLSLLDNPLQDIPLLAVLRSPLVGLTMDELALVRLASSGRFWTALRQFHRSFHVTSTGESGSHRGGKAISRGASTPKLRAALEHPELQKTAAGGWTKVDLFLQRFMAWRELVRRAALTQSLERILKETNYLAFLAAQDPSQQQRGNVSKLLGWARRFDQYQRQGLYRFLRFIEAQREAQIDHEPAPLETANAVRLMSIHQSKGLEFEVVVVGDVGKAFNFKDLRAEVVLDQELGLCPLIKPPFSEQRYPSLPHWLAQRRQRQETVGEEMRLLYVAMTRARQSLILVGTVNGSAIKRWATLDVKKARDLLSASSWLDWIGPWMHHITGSSAWVELPSGSAPLVHWFWHEPEKTVLPDASTALLADTAVPENAEAQSPHDPGVAALAARIAWRYPFAHAVQETAKVSVSRIRAAIVAESDLEVASSWRNPAVPPSVGRSEGLTPAEVGTAHHLFLEHVDLSRMQSLQELTSEAERLSHEGVLTETERRAISLSNILAFWESETGRQIFERQGWVHREVPFTARLPVSEIHRFQRTPSPSAESFANRPPIASNAPAAVDDDFVILTGVVDLVVLMEREIWILDFKTDQATLDEWPSKVSAYEPQMRLYDYALSRIYGRPVTRCWLHSLPLRRTTIVISSSNFVSPIASARG